MEERTREKVQKHIGESDENDECRAEDAEESKKCQEGVEKRVEERRTAEKEAVEPYIVKVGVGKKRDGVHGRVEGDVEERNNAEKMDSFERKVDRNDVEKRETSGRGAGRNVVEQTTVCRQTKNHEPRTNSSMWTPGGVRWGRVQTRAASRSRMSSRRTMCDCEYHGGQQRGE